ncbi:hypothetical protein KAU39_06630 [bacterium]|nr:hypothetical protein [bacterium]
MQENTQTDIGEYIEIFFRRKWLFIVPFVLIFTSSIVSIFFMPEEYKATSIILLETEGIIDPLIKNLAISPKLGGQINTLTARILTWPRLLELVTRLKLTEDIKSQVELEHFLKSFRKRIKVEMKLKNLIYVSYTGKDPYLVKEITDYIAQMFIDENVHFKSDGVESAIDFIQDQVKLYGKDLKDSEKKLSEYKIKAELDEVNKQYRRLEEQLVHHNETIVSEVKREQNPLVRQLTARLAILEGQVAELLVDAKEDHPLVVDLKEEIESIRKRVDSELEQTIVSSETSETNPIYQSIKQKLRELESTRSALKQSIRQIRKHGAFKYKKGSVTAAELSALDRDSRVSESIYGTLLKRLETARISQKLEEAEKGKKFKIIEPARLPLKPIKPNKKRIALIGLFLGTMSGGGLVLLFDYMDKSFRKIEEAKEVLKIPYLGVTSKIIVAKDYKKSN